MTACAFPGCATPATARNRADKDTCAYHQPVVVVENGNWMGEGRGHREPRSEDQ